MTLTEEDAECFEKLFLEDREMLTRYLRTRVHNDEEARELVQDTYVSMLESAAGRPFEAWRPLMIRTAINLANNRLRQRRQRDEVGWKVDIETVEQRTPELILAEQQERAAADADAAAVYRAIDDLPEESSAALRLYQNSLTHEQIAMKLGINERTVRRRIVRAMDEVRRKLGLGDDQ